ncbi:TonB-dependent receptor plug domain-containing protein [Faecalibacter macacae]|uniref:TonB-dependent receptor n=1 Tax=Faecalibacter macacae TaxID=1859289 RepID=A0A3L9MCM0_9FLAO|nr:TonB-dependent receptor [Faecalibacter macacae]RLZ10775.1 TonB-dependent receptor [Faecalibacter macacae]
MKKFSFLITLISPVIFAQNTNDTIAINEVSVINNRLNTPLSNENRNIYVLGKAELKKMPAKTLQEVLQYASGIDLRQRGPFGSQADISMDGGSFEQTLVLVNGVKIMDHQTAHNALNLPLPLEAIERIEVVRGPAARVYGNNSLTGVINIITRKPAKTGVYAHTYFGTNFKKDEEDSGDTFTNRGIQIGGNLAKENHQHQLYLSHEIGNGYRYNTAFENNKLYYQGNFQFNENNSLEASYGYVKNGFGANGFYAAPGDKNSKEIVETTLATIQSKHQLSEKLALMPRLNYRYNFDDYRYFKHDISRARSKHYSNSISGEINSTYKLNNGQIGIGLEYRNEQINSTSIKEHSRDNFGFYAEYKTDITPKLNTNIGTYINYNSQYGWQIFPGIDASYSINSNLKFVANAGTSQRIPSFTDLYLDQRPGNIGNPNVDSEKAFQTELGFRYNQSNWTLNAYYFYRNITNFIDWVRLTTDEPWQASNFGDMRTNGLNMKVTYLHQINPNQSLKLALSYSYLDPKFKNVDEAFNSKYKIESLKHQLINTIDYQLKNTSISLANRYNTRQSYKSYWITDVRINQNINDKFSIYLDAQNLFNTSYNEVGAIPLPSRWMSIGVRFNGI